MPLPNRKLNIYVNIIYGGVTGGNKIKNFEASESIYRCEKANSILKFYFSR
jgi:hypothetical protein